MHLIISKTLFKFAFFIMLVVFYQRINLCEARKNSKPPLIEDIIPKHRNRATHCSFGNQTYPIEQRWRPNLQPFGVYYCIRCECVAVQRKNRIVAKVKCKNINNDCPKPTCDDPVLLPERCCKTCPGEEGAFDELNPDLLTPKPTTTAASVATELAIDVNNNSDVQKKFSDDTEDNLRDSHNNNFIGEPSYKCYYDMGIYEDGAQWKAQNDDCDMCFCQRGRVKCEKEMCPKLSCANQTTPTGSCCPICSHTVDSSNSSLSSIKSCYFEGDKKHHMAGTRWHPYLPPFGFDKCSLCTCLADSLTIQCERNIDCPPLTCPEQEAYRENAMDCCKRCPNALPVKSIVSVDQMGDQRSLSGLVKSPNELMAAGGCRLKGKVYTNGDEWHPTVQPFGEVKCVKCRCKDGIHKCKRTNCPKLTDCRIVINKSNECCPICAEDSGKPKSGRRRRRRRRH